MKNSKSDVLNGRTVNINPAVFISRLIITTGSALISFVSYCPFILSFITYRLKIVMPILIQTSEAFVFVVFLFFITNF